MADVGEDVGIHEPTILDLDELRRPVVAKATYKCPMLLPIDENCRTIHPFEKTHLAAEKRIMRSNVGRFMFAGVVNQVHADGDVDLALTPRVRVIADNLCAGFDISNFTRCVRGGANDLAFVAVVVNKLRWSAKLCGGILNPFRIGRATGAWTRKQPSKSLRIWITMSK